MNDVSSKLSPIDQYEACVNFMHADSKRAMEVINESVPAEQMYSSVIKAGENSEIFKKTYRRAIDGLRRHRQALEDDYEVPYECTKLEIIKQSSTSEVVLHATFLRKKKEII